MPNWKKVIVSGSDAILNEITASGGINVGANILPDADNTLSLGSSTKRFQLNRGTPVTVTGSGTDGTITRFNGATEVENSTITNTDNLTTITHDNDGSDIFIVSGSNGELIKVTDSVTSTLFQVNDGSGITKLSVSSSGLTTTDDVSIDDWGSISASLSSIESDSTSQTFQQVTDNGNTTTNSIIINNAEFDSGKITVANGATGAFGTFSASTYAGAVVDYVVYTSDRANQRTGMVTVTSNTSEIIHSELVTTDIGNTDGMIITTTLGSGNFRVNMDNHSGASVDVIYNIRLLKI